MADTKIKGSKGSDNNSPSEARNTLRSRAIARVLDLLSEGPIKGLVGDKKGIYINEVSWENNNNEINFDGLTAELRYGDATQPAVSGFPAIEREIGAGQAIKYGNIPGNPELKPEIQINDSLVDSVRVTIQVQALFGTGDNTGDVFGNSVTIQFEVKNAATSYSVALTDTISGKTTSPYERSYRIPLPKNSSLTDLGAPFKIRVSRLTPDATSGSDPNGTTLSHYTEVIEHKLSYPDTAYIGMTFDTSLFKEGVPGRKYLIDGLKMQVPSNYFQDGIDIENYAPLSEVFTSATWSKSAINTPVVGNNVISPDGDLSAMALVPTVTNAAHFLSPASPVTGIPAAIRHVSSVYVKQLNAACSGVRFEVFASNGVSSFGSYYVNFNFSTGIATYGDNALVANGGVNAGYGAENVGNGWYRLWVSGYPSSSVPGLIPRVYLYGSTFGVDAYSASGSTLYAAVWGFQIHAGSAPYQYLKNTGTTKVTGRSSTRYYNGVWDGTFKVAWTDNPAWVLYMLLTHPRIGMGQWIDEALIDKWTLYSLAQYCDELVPDGFGGMEPRFTFNGVIRNRDDAYNIIQNIASMFRGVIYWGAGSAVVAWDAPKDASILVTPANVIDGMFEYKGVGWKARHSAAMVKWNDPTNLYKDAVEVVEDQDLILKFGWKPIETFALGCTSRGQAYRWGKWILYSEKYETETVTYKASFDHMIKDGTAVMPGDVIKIMDPSYAGVRHGGRIARVARNYLLHSNSFDNAVWAKTNATVTANAIVREDILFDRVFETAVTGNHFVRQQINLASANIKPGAVHNFSVYLTQPVSDAVPNIALQVGSGLTPASYSRINFNLVTGEWTVSENGFAIANFRAEIIGPASAQNVWRLSFDFTTLASPAGGDTLDARVYGLDSAGAISYAGNASNSFYVAQAQVINGAGVVKPIATTTTTRHAVVVDAGVTLLTSTAYTLSVVLPSGIVQDRVVTSLPGEEDTFQILTDFSEDPITNAMWVLSSPDVEPRLFRVLSIREQEQNIVEVTALYHNPDKFAMVEQDLTFETPNFSVLSLGPLVPPTNIAVDEYLYITVGNAVQSAASVSWSPPADEARLAAYELEVKAPGEDWKLYSTVSDVNVTITGINAGLYSFRVRSVGYIGSASPWQTLSDLSLFGLTQKPPNVTNFNMNAVGDQAYLTWDPITDPTVGYFVIKTQNVVTGALWGSSIVVLDNIPRTSTHVFVPLRFGTYLIKAVSIADVEAVSAAMVVSDVAGINNFNATATVVAQPTFTGPKTNCSVVSTDLVTTAVGGLFPAEAIFESSIVTDLSEIYTNRLTPTISASGQRASYVMDSWGVLSNVESLDGGVQDSWSVVIEYATTRVNPATALPTDWTDWKPLIVGDSTARAYKFRLRLISYDTSVQVRVSQFSVVIDMPDRVDGQQNASVPATTAGLVVTYANAFKDTPAVAVTIQNAQANDVATLSSESRTGFTAKITNGGTPVARTINWVAKGYGRV